MEPSLTVQVRVPSRYPPERVTWSRVMVTSPLVSEPLEVRVTPSDPLATGPFGSGSLPPPLLLGVAVLLPLGVVPPVGVRVNLDASVGGAGLVGRVVDLGLGLALAGYGCLPLVEAGELFEAGFDGVGAFLGPDS